MTGYRRIMQKLRQLHLPGLQRQRWRAHQRVSKCELQKEDRDGILGIEAAFSMSRSRFGVSLTKVNLLIVDDDSLLRSSLSQIFSGMNYEVRSAEDGVSALCEIDRKIPAIILSDLYMPRMSGFDLLAEVRSRFPSIMLIAMSASFSGSFIPDGVVADAFYEKAAGLRPLLKIMHNMATRCISSRPMLVQAYP
ncbi:response regulator [Terriglobus sp. YAF25]